MSTITQDPSPVRSRTARDSRGVRVAAMIAIALMAVSLVAFGLIVGAGDSPGNRSAANPVEQTGPFGGVRYDGGPEEGMLGTVPSHPRPEVRFAASQGRPDGGPEEGTRGPGH